MKSDLNDLKKLTLDLLQHGTAKVQENNKGLIQKIYGTREEKIPIFDEPKVEVMPQLVEYKKARSRIPQVKQAELFVSDERSAIDWLTNFLLKRPSTRSEIHPEYIPQSGSAKRKGEIIPELDQLLEDNFLKYDGTGEVPSQIHSYLSSNHKDQRGLDKSDPALIAKAKDRCYMPDPNKAQDLEKKREKALLKEFEAYRSFTGRKIKESRLEVLRAGFRAARAARGKRRSGALRRCSRP